MLHFVLVVPALNEERVIAATLKSLLGLSGDFSVLVVDDASDDGTVGVVEPFLIDERVQLIVRPDEEARLGKGAVLNAAYHAICRSELVHRHSPHDLIMVVFDSDGRVDPGFLRAVTPYFRDPRTAGVQSAVRMFNARQNLLTFWQHFEFLLWDDVFLRSKDYLGSATLGGNGQCVRLAALSSLGPEPWKPSLTEDLDLSLRLLVRGWRLRFCSNAAVYQEAVPRLRQLVRQRSRWFQGHLASWQYLPALIRSRLPIRARIDLVVFLLMPIACIPVGLHGLASWLLFWLDVGYWRFADLAVSYAFGFALTPLATEVWWRIGDDHRWRFARAVIHGHLFVFYSWIWFLASLVACWNVLMGKRAWQKTTRIQVEQPRQGAKAAEAA
jgi:cellulose synthase/poly-beta-1,6-N-acetylglucosamine synthase-like glycosyltransferase